MKGRIRNRSKPWSYKNIYVLWMGILIVFVLHSLVVFTEEENRIRNELVALDEEVYLRANDYSDITVRYADLEGDGDNANVNLSDTLQDNDSNTTTQSKGLFGRQEDMENVRVEYYENKTRPASCDGCFRVNFTFDSSSICNTTGEQDRVDIIIVIPTAYSHIRQRMALRTTWLLRTMKNTAKVRYAFILGQTGSKQMLNAVLKEKAKFNDIVMANFTDTFMNLTLKTLAAFHWTKTWCPQSKIVVKADDDVYINLENLIGFCGKNYGSTQRTVIGGCWEREPIRRPSSKYYVSNETYANATFPMVCAGSTYITSLKVIDRILSVVPDVPFFYLEDVYVAFCLKKLGLAPRKHSGILTRRVKHSVPLCVFKGPQLISAHIRNPRKIEEIWRTQCPKKT